jgi:hypothetical protein
MNDKITFSFSPSFFSLPDTIPANFDAMFDLGSGHVFLDLVKEKKKTCKEEKELRLS